jgi:hypothetical protein
MAECVLRDGDWEERLRWRLTLPYVIERLYTYVQTYIHTYMHTHTHTHTHTYMGNGFCLKYTDIPEVFLTLHKIDRSYCNTIRRHYCVEGLCCTVVVMQVEYVCRNSGPSPLGNTD